MTGYEILLSRGVTRLCHFTKFSRLTHILFSKDGIVSSDEIKKDVKSVNDKMRYDGATDYVCCSVEYPNSWFLSKNIEKNYNDVFNDWVVLYIKPEILNIRKAKYSQCNAGTARGGYIRDDMSTLYTIYENNKFTRTPDMLPACPTDGQAEILIKDNIPAEYISGIAVGNMDMARRVYAMLKLPIYNQEKLPIYAAPDVLTPSWRTMIESGKRPVETEI